MWNGSLILVVVVCVAVGCDTHTESTQASTQPSSAQPGATVAQPQYGWYQTHGDAASQVLVTKLSIPEVFKEHTEEIRIARYVCVDASGLLQLPPEMVFGMRNGDGRSEKGGFGYSGAINVIGAEDGEHDTVVLDVSYHWTTPAQVKGQLKEKVPVKIGVPLDVQLPGGCRLQIFWRPVPQSQPGVEVRSEGDARRCEAPERILQAPLVHAVGDE